MSPPTQTSPGVCECRDVVNYLISRVWLQRRRRIAEQKAKGGGRGGNHEVIFVGCISSFGPVVTAHPHLTSKRTSNFNQRLFEVLNNGRMINQFTVARTKGREAYHSPLFPFCPIHPPWTTLCLSSLQRGRRRPFHPPHITHRNPCVCVCVSVWGWGRNRQRRKEGEAER